jgi:hypothetical protein
MTFNLSFTVLGTDAEDILNQIYAMVQRFHGRLPANAVFEHDMKVDVFGFSNTDERFEARVTIPLNPFQRR